MKMKKIFNYVVLSFLALVLVSCAEKETKDVVAEKTGLELIAIGSINFGGVEIETFRDAAVKVVNHGPGNIENLDIKVQEPFAIQSISSPCTSNSLPEGQDCLIVVRFSPVEAGEYQEDITVAGQTLGTRGLGLLDGSLSLYEEDATTSLSSWNLGVLPAGTPVRKIAVLKNLGDIALPLKIADLQMPEGMYLSTTSCKSIIVGGGSCTLEFLIEKQKSGDADEYIDFSASVFQRQALSINVQTSTTPREPSGLIAFEEYTRIMIADEEDEQEIVSLEIRDQYSNPVADNTPISLSAVGLEIVGGTTVEEEDPTGKVTLRSTHSVTTMNGKITFRLKTTKVKGSYGFYAIAGDANGYGDIKTISGPAHGEIKVKSYTSSIIANGQQSARIDLEALFDKNGNLVENGTQVFFTLLGEGSLDTNMRTTIAGQTTVIVTSPTNIGFADLLIESGPIYDDQDRIIDYTASGIVRINYIPGQPAGEIPVVPVSGGIYADPTDVTAIEDRGFPEKTAINVGPIFDENENLVAFGTDVKVWIRNGVNLSNPNATEDDYTTFQTDENGRISFEVSGSGNRGKLEIIVQAGAGQGYSSVWAYKTINLKYQNGPQNPIKLFQTYSKYKPAPDLKWGLSYNYEQISFKNNSYWGFIKNNGDPIREEAPYPYLLWDCFFPANEFLYMAPCKSLSGHYITAREITHGKPFRDRFMQKPVNKAHYILPLSSDVPDMNVLNCSSVAEENCGTTMNLRGVKCIWDDSLNNDAGGCKEDYKNDCQRIIENENACKEYRSAGANTCLWEPVAGTQYFSCKENPNIRQPILGYMPEANKLMIHGGYTEILDYGVAFGYNASLTSVFTDVYGTSSMNVYSITGNEDFDIGDRPSNQSVNYFANSDNNLYLFGGMTSYPGSAAFASSDFFEYDNLTDLWYSIAPNGDPDLIGNNSIPEHERDGLPKARYGHGLHYIAETSSLYLFGGFVQDQNIPTVWHNLDDFWKIDMSPREESRENAIEWKRLCDDCGFPQLSANLTRYTQEGVDGVGLPDSNYNPAKFLDGEMSLVSAKMIWDEMRQVAYIYWQDTATMLEFDPYTDEFKPVDQATKGVHHFKGMRQIVYNRQIGRTFAYQRIPPVNHPAALSSWIWSWDGDNEENTYIKAEFTLGEGSKDFVQGLKPRIYGYGHTATGDATTESCLSGLAYDADKTVCYREYNKGLEMSFFNFNTKTYDVMGENYDNTLDQDSPEPGVITTFLTPENTPNISDYISEDGKIVMLLNAKGIPGDLKALGFTPDYVDLDVNFGDSTTQVLSPELVKNSTNEIVFAKESGSDVLVRKQNDFNAEYLVCSKNSVTSALENCQTFLWEDVLERDEILYAPFKISSGCENAPFHSNESQAVWSCQGDSPYACKTFCHKGACSSSIVGLFETYFNTNDEFDYVDFEYTTDNLRAECGGDAVHGIKVRYTRKAAAPKFQKIQTNLKDIYQNLAAITTIAPNGQRTVRILSKYHSEWRHISDIPLTGTTVNVTTNGKDKVFIARFDSTNNKSFVEVYRRSGSASARSASFIKSTTIQQSGDVTYNNAQLSDGKRFIGFGESITYIDNKLVVASTNSDGKSQVEFFTTVDNINWTRSQAPIVLDLVTGITSDDTQITMMRNMNGKSIIVNDEKLDGKSDYFILEKTGSSWAFTQKLGASSLENSTQLTNDAMSGNMIFSENLLSIGDEFFEKNQGSWIHVGTVNDNGKKYFSHYNQANRTVNFVERSTTNGNGLSVDPDLCWSSTSGTKQKECMLNIDRPHSTSDVHGNHSFRIDFIQIEGTF